MRSFPERRVARALVAAGGEADIPALAAASGLSTKEVGESLRWLTQRGWAAKDGARLRATAAWAGGEPAAEPDERLVLFLAEHGPARRAAVLAAGEALDAALERLAARAGVVERRERRRRLVAMTVDGAGAPRGRGRVPPRGQRADARAAGLGPLARGAFRAYDVTPAAGPSRPGKEHPLQRICRRRGGPSSRWVSRSRVPVGRVGVLGLRRAVPAAGPPGARDAGHLLRGAAASVPRCPTERAGRARARARTRTAATPARSAGATAGTRSWRGGWCCARTRRPPPSARWHADPQPPRKVFSVGRVFRRETIDYKHLPVFLQVDGIIIDENATLRDAARHAGDLLPEDGLRAGPVPARLLPLHRAVRRGLRLASSSGGTGSRWAAPASSAPR